MDSFKVFKISIITTMFTALCVSFLILFHSLSYPTNKAESLPYNSVVKSFNEPVNTRYLSLNKRDELDTSFIKASILDPEESTNTNVEVSNYILVLFGLLMVGVGGLFFTKYVPKFLKLRRGKTSKELVEALFEDSGIGIALIDHDGRPFRANSFICDMLGYTESELKKMTFGEFTHPEDVQKDEDLFKELLKGNRKYYHLEKRYIAKDGSILWGSLSVSIAFTKKGEIDYVIGMIQNITKRKEVEDELTDFENIIEISKKISGIIPWIYDVENDLEIYSDDLLEFYELDERPPKIVDAVIDFINKEDAPELVETNKEKIALGEPWKIEYQLNLPSGTQKYVLSIISKIIKNDEGDVIKIIGTTQDVTASKEREEQLKREAEILQHTIQTLEEVQEAAQIGIWEFALDTKNLLFSKEALKLFGIDEAQEITPEESIAYFKKGHQEILRNAFKELIENSKNFILELIFVKKDGKEIWLRVSGNTVFNDGEPVSIKGIFFNIDNEKRASQTILERQKLLQTSNKVAGLGTWIWDVETGKVEYSEELIDILELDANPLKERNTHDLLKDILNHKSKTVDDAEFLDGELWTEEREIISKNGVTKYVQITGGECIANEEGSIVKVMGTALDVTEYRNRELEVRQKVADFKKMNDLFSESQKVAKIGSWEIDLKENELFWSDEVYRIHEVEIGTKINVAEAINFYREDFREKIETNLQKAIEKNKGWDIEGVIKTQTGKELWIRAIGKPFYEEGELTSLRGLFMDIDEQKRKNIELDNTNKKLALSVEVGRIAIWILDIETGKVEWNEQAESVFGVPKKDLARNLHELYNGVHPEDFFHVKHEIQKSINYGRRLDVDFKIKHPSGQVKHLSARGNTILDKNGNIDKMIGITLDVTERARMLENLKAQEAQLRSFVTQAPVAVAMLDTEMKYITVSDKWLADYKISKKIVIGKSHYDIFPESVTSSKWRSLHQRVLSGEKLYENKERIQNIDGSYRWVSWNLIPWYNEPGEIGGIIMFTADVSSEVEYSKKLEKEVKERTKELESVNKELEAFSYSISHDLRAPLRSINGFTDILIEEYSNSMDDEGKRLIGIVKDSALMMGKLIDDILGFSKLGKKSIQVSDIDMNILVESVCEEEKHRSINKNVVFSISDLPKAKGDLVLIKQVVVNILSNALKYSSKQEVIKIDIDFKIENNKVIYIFKDNGAGFSMDYHDKMFGVFQRLHTQSEFEGTGVGLAIVKRIINKHSGEVWAESEIGKGATFFISLPIA